MTIRFAASLALSLLLASRAMAAEPALPDRQAVDHWSLWGLGPVAGATVVSDP